MFGPGASAQRRTRLIPFDSNLVDLIQSIKNEGLFVREDIEEALEQTIEDAKSLRDKFTSWAMNEAPEWNVQFGTRVLARRLKSTGDWHLRWSSIFSRQLWPKVIVSGPDMVTRSRYDGIQKLLRPGEAIASN